MNLDRTFSRVAAALLFGAFGCAYAEAASCAATVTLPATCTGSLSSESGTGSVVLESFTLDMASSLTIFTTSYGGGKNLDNTTTSSGGFEPNITLYNSQGLVLADQNPGFSPIANPDPGNHWKGDGYLNDPHLSSGTYYITLTDWQNQQLLTATSLNLSMPIAQQFTGPGGTSFTDVQGNNRNGNYALDIESTPLTSSTPEPATFWLIIPIFAAAFWLRKRRPDTC